MTAPTHFNCPHCSYAYQPGDPRFAVPAGQANRVVTCPGCRGAFRVWAEGASPRSGRSVGWYIGVAIVVILAAIFLAG
jgi:hypothetical protein